MKISVSKFLLTASLCLLPASLIHATPDTTLKLNLNGYFQAKISQSNQIVRGKVKKTRVSTKQILKLISQESRRSIPSGSQLKVNPNGTTYVVDRKGDTVLDSSRYVQVRFLDDTEIIDGSRNISTGKENTWTYFKIVLVMNFNSLSGTTNGLAIAKSNISAPDRDGVQRFRVDIESKVNGRGRINEGPGFYDGKINLNGRSATIR